MNRVICTSVYTAHSSRVLLLRSFYEYEVIWRWLRPSFIFNAPWSSINDFAMGIALRSTGILCTIVMWSHPAQKQRCLDSVIELANTKNLHSKKRSKDKLFNWYCKPMNFLLLLRQVNESLKSTLHNDYSLRVQMASVLIITKPALIWHYKELSCILCAKALKDKKLRMKLMWKICYSSLKRWWTRCHIKSMRVFFLIALKI